MKQEQAFCVTTWVEGDLICGGEWWKEAVCEGESVHLGPQRDAPHSPVLTSVGSDCPPGNMTPCQQSHYMIHVIYE